MISVGNKITVLSRVQDELIPEQAIIIAHVDAHLYRWRPVDGTEWRGTVIDDHEGVEWISGHHAADSPAVAALRTAYALARAA